MAVSEDGFKKPETNSWKPGKPGDAIKGIYTGSVREFEGQYGKTHIYELVGIEGEWHEMDEDGKPVGSAVKVEAGTSYSLFARKTFEDDLKRAKPGQKILVKFTESRKPKSGGKMYKYVEALLGPMDEEWVKQNVVPVAADSDTEPF